MHYIPKEEIGNEPMLLHCKNKGRTQHSSSHRKHTPVCWTILQKLGNGRKEEEKKNWLFSFSTSLLYHLPHRITSSDALIPSQKFLCILFAPHLDGFASFFPLLFSCFPSTLLFSSLFAHSCSHSCYTTLKPMSWPRCSSSYSFLLLSWYFLPLILSVLGVVPINLQSLPFCTLKILG